MKAFQTILTLTIASGIFFTSYGTAQGIEPSQKLVVNNFLSDPTNIVTRILITDVDGIGPNIRVSINHEDGRLVYERYENLMPFGTLNFNPLQYVNAYQHGLNQNPKFRGSIRIESDGGNVIGQYWISGKEGSKSAMSAATPASSATDGFEKLICQSFVSDRNVESAIIISNLETVRPVSVNVKFFSVDGGMISAEKLTIQPNGCVRLEPFKATKGLKVIGTAYISLIGAGKVSGEYWQASSDGKSHMIMPLLSVNRIR